MTKITYSIEDLKKVPRGVAQEYIESKCQIFGTYRGNKCEIYNTGQDRLGWGIYHYNETVPPNSERYETLEEAIKDFMALEI